MDPLSSLDAGEKANTLPEGNSRIFASRYKLYLPSEEELADELLRERHSIEIEQRLTENKQRTSSKKKSAK